MKGSCSKLNSRESHLTTGYVLEGTMSQSEEPEASLGLHSPDPLVREAFLMAYDYIDYVTKEGAGGIMGPAPTACTAALRHAGDELLTRFPIFFRRWPRIFQDVTENTACPMLISILDEHFFPPIPNGRQRDLSWSAVLSVYVLAGQMALHCSERGMVAVLPQLKECVGIYVERVICPDIKHKGGWTLPAGISSLNKRGGQTGDLPEYMIVWDNHATIRQWFVTHNRMLREVGSPYSPFLNPVEFFSAWGWKGGFIARFGEKTDLEGRVKQVCFWTLLVLAGCILSYFVWRRITSTLPPTGHNCR